MKASIYTQYGSPDVLKINETEKPVPKDDEILIKIHATSVNYGDLTARNFKNISAKEFNMPLPLLFPARLGFGFNKPKQQILGSEYAGEIETVGNNVSRFKKGDSVFGYRGQKMGCYAEYVCMPENGMVALKPGNLNFEEAAMLPYGALMAFNLLKKADIQKEQKVLINGASGGIGSAAVQIAKNYYKTEVTGVCGTNRVGFVRALGADKVIDYTKEDFTKNGERYDLIFDILGRSSFSRCKNSLTENGIYLLASFKTGRLFQMLLTSIKGGKRVICALAPEKPDDLLSIKQLIEEGKLKAIIDKIFPLEQAADAHRYVEDGHKKGHIALKVI